MGVATLQPAARHEAGSRCAGSIRCRPVPGCPQLTVGRRMATVLNPNGLRVSRQS